MERPELNNPYGRVTPLEAWTGSVVVRAAGQPEIAVDSGLKERLVMKALSDAVLSEVYTPQTAQDRLDELFPGRRINLAEFQPDTSD